MSPEIGTKSSALTLVYTVHVDRTEWRSLTRGRITPGAVVATRRFLERRLPALPEHCAVGIQLKLLGMCQNEREHHRG